MFLAQARWLLLVGLSSGAFVACGGEEPAPAGGAGTPSGGSSAGSQVGGSPSSAGTSAGTTNGGKAGAGTAGSGTSGGGAGGAGGGAGGAGGGTGGAGGASGGGGTGGGAAEPTAVANIMGLNGMAVTGTATFTQGATMTKLVINLTACPNGAHASHLHAVKDCGSNGDAAGNHWVPNGEMLGDYTCANNMGMHEVSKPTATWTVGGPAASDVTKYSFMVHEMGGDAPGGRIGCGVIDLKP